VGVKGQAGRLEQASDPDVIAVDRCPGWTSLVTSVLRLASTRLVSLSSTSLRLGLVLIMITMPTVHPALSQYLGADSTWKRKATTPGHLNTSGWRDVASISNPQRPERHLASDRLSVGAAFENSTRRYRCSPDRIPVGTSIDVLASTPAALRPLIRPPSWHLACVEWCPGG
jgi:hypothetical protein